MYEAQFYESRQHGVLCRLCPHFCRLQEGEAGLCGVRRESGGKLYTLNYGLCAAMAVDPIEKKPLYHFYPGQTIFSVGTSGCNLDCGFCQNWELVRAGGINDINSMTPQVLLKTVFDRSPQKPFGIAYTYGEPGMWYEFVMETAALARQKGLKNVMVTNGFLNPQPLKHLLGLIDAFNIDVKAFHDDYYQIHCAGSLRPVLRYVELAAASAHVELTYLVVPELNDSEQEMKRFSSWVAGLNPEIPVHLTRYYPHCRFTKPPTPVGQMERLLEVARQQLSYVYLGNIPGHDAANTFCPNCKKTIIRRTGYRTETLVRGGICPACGQRVNILDG